jgi:hypothetical protein
VTLLVDRTIWQELFAAARRYDDDRAGLGDEFIEAVDDSLQTILLSPQTWPVWPGIRPEKPPIQRYVMDRFPFAIGYQVAGDAVVVVVVAHAKRRPGYWR